ncbi:MAG: conserved phage C-terminal domain-containing protein [Ruminococcus sp.]|nr:conserved phage C-terminal domain-containing protein [Ruminococcus sp.]
METPNTYIRLYFSSLPQLEMLSNEQIGLVIRTILRSKSRGAELDFEGDKMAQLVAMGLLGRIDEDYIAYDKKCASNRENGAKGGAPLGNQNAKKKTTETTETTVRLNSTLNKKENKKVNNKESKKDIYIVECDSTVQLETEIIIDYLNDRTGASYRASTKATQKLVKARLAEGFTVDDFKTVIDSRNSQWGADPKMRQYLRPDTLFSQKFESYLNYARQIPAQSESKRRCSYNIDDFDKGAIGCT